MATDDRVIVVRAHLTKQRGLRTGSEEGDEVAGELREAEAGQSQH